MNSILVNKSRTVESWFTKHTLGVRRKLLNSGWTLPLTASSLFSSKTLAKNAEESVLARLYRPRASFEALLKELLTSFRMLDWKQSFLLLFNPWVELRNSESARRAALPLELLRPLFSRSSYTDLACENSRPPPLGPGAKKDCCFRRLTLVIWVFEQNRACSQSSQMRTSFSLRRVRALTFPFNACVKPPPHQPPHRSYLHRQDYTSTISPREYLPSVQSFWSF